MGVMIPTREFLEYEAPDGEVYQFHVPSNKGRWLVSQSGWGTPPIDYVTQRGPFQHGQTVKDFFLQPRVIQLLLHQAYCDREEWWTGRGNLLNGIRPNRQLTPNGVVPGILRRILPDGEIRALDVFLTSGPTFEPRSTTQWMEWSFREVLRFTAYDPVVYDPDIEGVIFSCDGNGELQVPIFVPLFFGPGYCDITQNVNYLGTWLSYPIITIVGPINVPRIDNITTDEHIELNYTVPVGRAVQIDCRYGFKTVVNDLGVNLIGTVTTDSDLGTFHIAADPEAPGGVNQIEMQGAGTAPGVSGFLLQYYTRYFGI